jgi:predicted transposase/invertase (TIGR01784 family)
MTHDDEGINPINATETDDIINNMERFINPLTDFAFKKIFSDEVVLKGFLNSVLDLPVPIKHLDYRNIEHKDDDRLNGKTVLFDLYCTDENDRHFVIEMQKNAQRFLFDRLFHYVTYPVREQTIAGDESYELEQVYALAILDFKNFKNDQVIHHFRFQDNESGITQDHIQVFTIEVPKFAKALDDLSNNKEKWVYWLRNVTRFSDPHEKLDAPGMREAFSKAEYYNYKPFERTQYLLEQKKWRDYFATIDYQQELGREKGRIEGIALGKAEGKLEALKQNLRLLLDNGVSIEAIAQINGLSVQDIEQLIQSFDY